MSIKTWLLMEHDLRPITVRVKVVLDQPKQEFLVKHAITHGWKRIDPKRRWTKPERQEACHWALHALLQRAFE